MSSGKEIRDLNKIYLEAVYGQSAGQKLEKREKDDDAAGAPYTVTAADKKGNTPAYQGLKAGKKNVKTGKPLYKAADHLKDDKDWGYDKDGNSLNPVDIEKKKKKDDDLAGAPKNEAADLAPTVKKNFGAEDIAKAHHKEPMPTLKKNPLKNEALENIRALVEKEVKVKDTRRTVDAIRAYDKSKDASRDATYDTDEGDKEKAAIEKKYAAKERGEIDKDDPNWKKRKYHTGIHGEQLDRESQLWDEVAANLTELHELGGVKFKVVPFNLEEDEKWIQGAVKRPGAFTKKAKEAGMSVQQFAAHVDANKDKYSTRTERQANLAQTFASMKKEGAEYDALSEFLINEGADEEAVNHIMANWLLEGYQRNPEEGERKERESAKKREAIPGQARRGMPPRGDKKREEFEKWYAANVR